MRPRRSLLALALLASPAVAQTTWYVDAAGAPPGTGTQADPYTSIQYAISQASTLPGDTVLVQPGTYQERLDFLGKVIAVRSSGGPSATIIDSGGLSGDLVTIQNGEGAAAVLEGFSLVHSSVSTPGRGLLIVGASPTIRDCVVSGHGAFGGFGKSGGGALLDNSSATIVECQFLGNYAEESGAGIYLVDSTPTITDSLFEANRTGVGGAIAAESSHVDIFRTTFLNNGLDVGCGSAGGRGGGVYLSGSDALFVDCLLEMNVGGGTGNGGGGVHADSSHAELVRTVLRTNCGEGGGVSFVSSTGSLIDCTVSDNGGGVANGGGIALVASDVWVLATTISDNRAGVDEHDGGGIYQLGGSLSMIDCIIDGNFSTCSGGGLFLDGPATLSNCTITDNLANAGGLACTPQGGGVWTLSPVLLERCLVAGNRLYPYDCTGSFLGIPDYGFGGGIAGPAQLVNCVLYANTAFGDAGGAFGATLLNTIVLDNRLGDCDTVGAIDNLLACTVTYCNVQGGVPGTGNIDLPPRFWGPPIEDFHLLPGSPCIDAGDPASPLDPDGSRADMGLYPFDPNYCGSPFNYCTGKTNSLGCVPFLSTNGFPSATSTGPFEIIGNDMVPSEAGFMVYGFNRNQLGFHGGTLCVKAPVARVLPPQHSKATGTPPCTGRLLFGFNKRIQSGVDVLLVPGQTVYIQLRQRDPNDPAGFGDSLTDAVQFTICP